MFNSGNTLGLWVEVAGQRLPEQPDALTGLTCVTIPVSHDPPVIHVVNNLLKPVVAAMMLCGDKTVQFTLSVPAGQDVPRSESFPDAADPSGQPCPLHSE